ncbi:MAG: YIP1 family protein [Ignavibacteriae bacterium]|nr:YIP1 family protein [Ignavibacteriota bacterium]
MEEENLQNVTEESDFPPEPPEEFSSTDAMIGVFTEPGQTFETISKDPQRNYWILPTIIFIVLNLIATFITFSDPEILGNMMDERMSEAREKIEEKIKNNEISREEGEKAIEMQEKFSDPSSPVFIAFGYGAGIIGPFIQLFILGLIYFLGLKILKSPANYSGILNVIGLAFLISGIQHLVSSLLSILMGKVVTVGLGIFLSSDQLGSALYSIVSSFDIFSIWFFVVVSIGIAHIGKISKGQAYGMVFGLWIIWTLLTSFVATISIG